MLGYRSVGRALRPCQVICLAASTVSLHPGHAATTADLSLGAKAADISDLQLSQGAALRADVLAHFSAALQFESSGKLRQALDHYLAVFKADPSNADLASHTAGIAMQFQGRASAMKILEDAVRANPRAPAPLLNLARSR